jgi:hypothetical protein
VQSQGPLRRDGNVSVRGTARAASPPCFERHVEMRNRRDKRPFPDCDPGGLDRIREERNL